MSDKTKKTNEIKEEKTPTVTFTVPEYLIMVSKRVSEKSESEQLDEYIWEYVQAINHGQEHLETALARIVADLAVKEKGYIERPDSFGTSRFIKPSFTDPTDCSEDLPILPILF